jgi:predicted PP-loop superfamily ATPase
MKAEIKKIDNTQCLVITLPLEEPRESSTGNSMIVASSGGTISTGVMYPGTKDVIKTSFSAFIVPEELKRARKEVKKQSLWKPNTPTEG